MENMFSPDSRKMNCQRKLARVFLPPANADTRFALAIISSNQDNQIQARNKHKNEVITRFRKLT